MANELAVILKMQNTQQFMSDASKAQKAVKGVGDESKRAGATSVKAAGETSRATRSTTKTVRNLVAGYLTWRAVAKGKNWALDSAKAARANAAQTEQVIKSTGGAANVTSKYVGALSAKIRNQTGVSAGQIRSGQNMLLTFKQVRNEVGKGNNIYDQATGAIVDLSVAMKKDMRGSAILVGKALNDPLKGMAALSRVGIQLTGKQKKQIETYVKQGKVMKAQKIILAELNSQFGGQAKAQATAGKKLSAMWGSLGSQIGTQLLPYIDKLTNVGVKVLSWLIGGSKSAKIFTTSLKYLVPAIAALLIIGKVNSVVRGMDFSMKGLNTTMKANPFMMWTTLLFTVGTALVAAYQNSATFRRIVQKLGDVGVSVFNALKRAAGWVVDKIQEAIDKAKEAVDKIKSMVSTVKGWLPDAFGGGDPNRQSIGDWMQSTPSQWSNVAPNAGAKPKGAKALGGNIYTPGIYTVGETGTERVYLPRNSYVQASNRTTNDNINVKLNAKILVGSKVLAEIVAEEVETQIARK